MSEQSAGPLILPTKRARVTVVKPVVSVRDKYLRLVKVGVRLPRRRESKQIQAIAALRNVVEQLAENIKWTTYLKNVFLAQ